MAVSLFGIIISESVSSSDPNRVRGTVIYCVFVAFGGLLLWGLTEWIHDPDQLYLVFTLILLAAVTPSFF